MILTYFTRIRAITAQSTTHISAASRTNRPTTLAANSVEVGLARTLSGRGAVCMGLSLRELLLVRIIVVTWHVIVAVEIGLIAWTGTGMQICRIS